ncbi:hypothetical protein HYC85_008331 [Camellia sinensis]|uniref:Uncharacterized protein n=1 Tax=Camellia sinensis TaxID=4442 RepID=A0A7J7HSC6_CAMSI|nr:hypothetical protein HYC85_008331 [Camellia sinensis]
MLLGLGASNSENHLVCEERRESLEGVSIPQRRHCPLNPLSTCPSSYLTIGSSLPPVHWMYLYSTRSTQNSSDYQNGIRDEPTGRTTLSNLISDWRQATSLTTYLRRQSQSKQQLDHLDLNNDMITFQLSKHASANFKCIRSRFVSK